MFFTSPSCKTTKKHEQNEWQCAVKTRNELRLQDEASPCPATIYEEELPDASPAPRLQCILLVFWLFCTKTAKNILFSRCCVTFFAFFRCFRIPNYDQAFYHGLPRFNTAAEVNHSSPGTPELRYQLQPPKGAFRNLAQN